MVDIIYNTHIHTRMHTAHTRHAHTRHAQGKLFYYPLGQGEDSVLVINTDTLTVETSLELDGTI